MHGLYMLQRSLRTCPCLRTCPLPQSVSLSVCVFVRWEQRNGMLILSIVGQMWPSIKCKMRTCVCVCVCVCKSVYVSFRGGEQAWAQTNTTTRKGKEKHTPVIVASSQQSTSRLEIPAALGAWVGQFRKGGPLHYTLHGYKKSTPPTRPCAN